ncbi:unnamed protein product, partial [Allacma fusca]
SNLAH